MDSLTLFRLVIEIGQKLNLRIPFHELNTSMTLMDLSMVLQKEKEDNSCVDKKRNGSVCLPMQKRLITTEFKSGELFHDNKVNYMIYFAELTGGVNVRRLEIAYQKKEENKSCNILFDYQKLYNNVGKAKEQLWNKAYVYETAFVLVPFVFRIYDYNEYSEVAIEFASNIYSLDDVLGFVNQFTELLDEITDTIHKK